MYPGKYGSQLLYKEQIITLFKQMSAAIMLEDSLEMLNEFFNAFQERENYVRHRTIKTP